MQGLKFILNQYRETTANMNVEKSYAKVYRIDISFDNKTIYLEPKEGYTLSNKTVEGVRRAIDKRNDVKSRFSAEAKSLIPESCITEPVNLGNTSDGLNIGCVLLAASLFTFKILFNVSISCAAANL